MAGTKHEGRVALSKDWDIGGPRAKRAEKRRLSRARRRSPEEVEEAMREDLVEEAIEEATRGVRGNAFRCAGCKTVQPLTRTPAGSLRSRPNYLARPAPTFWALEIVCPSCAQDQTA